MKQLNPLRENTVVALCALLLFWVITTAARQQDAATATNRYPNELPEFRFYQYSALRSLAPLVSTINDVRHVLGTPQKVHDASQFTKPYPGDKKALSPVFMYEFGDWTIHVYFSKNCFDKLPKSVPRLCHIDLWPRKPVAIDLSKLPKSLVKRHVVALDAEWDEYSDGTGLRYEVSLINTQYGWAKPPGELECISYGPPVIPAQSPD